MGILLAPTTNESAKTTPSFIALKHYMAGILRTRDSNNSKNKAYIAGHREIEENIVAELVRRHESWIRHAGLGGRQV